MSILCRPERGAMRRWSALESKAWASQPPLPWPRLSRQVVSELYSHYLKVCSVVNSSLYLLNVHDKKKKTGVSSFHVVLKGFFGNRPISHEPLPVSRDIIKCIYISRPVIFQKKLYKKLDTKINDRLEDLSHQWGECVCVTVWQDRRRSTHTLWVVLWEANNTRQIASVQSPGISCIVVWRLMIQQPESLSD